jgi:hypothetical protein
MDKTDENGGETEDKLELFPVPDVRFTSASEFIDYLKCNYRADGKGHELTVVVGTTERPRGDLEQALHEFGFETTRSLGEVMQLRAPYEDGVLECYFTYEDPGVLLFFTNFRKTEEIPRISDFLKSDERSYSMFFPPMLLREAIKTLLHDHSEMTVTEFTARRGEYSRMPSDLRPHYKRTVSYWGDDGIEALRELESAYGLVVQRAVVVIPEMCKFGMDCRGFITANWGETNCALDVLVGLIAKSRKTRRGYDQSSYRLALAGTAGKAFEVGVSTPMTILLTKDLSYAEVVGFENRLQESGYSVLATLAQEGSLYLSSDLITSDGHRLRVKSDGRRIRVFSGYDRTIRSFMAFYEFVTSQIDPGAEVIA